MEHRILGKTGYNISAVSLGAWQIGGKWGSAFDPAIAQKTLETAADHGVNFIDTADVYEDGESEKAIGRFVAGRSERIYVATKCGRKLNPHTDEAYTPAAMRQFVEDSLGRLGLETLDLIQLHCPPSSVYDRPEIFEVFDRLKEEGKIQHLGVSVEKVSEAEKAITYENVSTVQIIFNMFRLKPAIDFFQKAQEKNVGIIARVPLASGLLTGKFTAESTFETGDHRHFNRNGEAFDKGETFSGVPYETGVKAVEMIRDIFQEKTPLSTIALKWILMHPAVSCVIPGASCPEQISQNLHAMSIADLSPGEMEAIAVVYESHIRAIIHDQW